jgi:hypothetical protein
VGIEVRVQEFSGVLVKRLDGPANAAALCSFVTEPGLYPMLAGVDPYDDTCFNPRQAAVLTAELRAVAERAEDEPTRAAAIAVLELAALLEAAPGRPHHRRLMFIGD